MRRCASGVERDAKRRGSPFGLQCSAAPSDSHGGTGWSRRKTRFAGVSDLSDAAIDPDSGLGKSAHYHPRRRNAGQKLMLRARKNETGATTIEFAFGGVSLLILVVSLVQMSLAMWSYHTLAYAVREG